MYVALRAMPVTLYANKHLLCARWQKITLEDLDALLTRAQSIERAEGRKLIYAGLQYEDTPLPDRELSRLLIERAKVLAKSCDRFYLVLAARGVTATLHRTAIRSMLTVARIAGANVDRVRLVESVDAMLADAERDLPAPRAEIRAGLAALGIT